MTTLLTPSQDTNPLLRALGQLLYTAQVTEYQFQQDADLIRAFREATPDLWLQLQSDGTLINVKSSPQSHLFRDTAAILHRPIDELLPPEPAHVLRAALERTRREQKPTTFEWTLTDDADVRHFEAHVTSLNSQQLLVILHDVTAQWQALEEFRDLPRRLWNAQEEERRRLSSDLHDEIGQDLTAILLGVNRVKEGLPDEARALLAETEAALQALTGKIRRLAQDLRPATLDQLGLAGALKGLLLHYVRQTALHVEWQVPDRLPFQLEEEKQGWIPVDFCVRAGLLTSVGERWQIVTAPVARALAAEFIAEQKGGGSLQPRHRQLMTWTTALIAR